MAIKNCYIYTRVSTAAQVEGYSLDAQMETLRGYAGYKELRIAGEYCDAGKSGKDIKGRPAFRQMMDDVRSQKDAVDFVLVFKLSRFGRNAADILRSLQILEDYGINLVSVNEAIDSSTPGGKLTLSILSAVAEMEHENITVQFMAGKTQKILNGDWSGGTIPYGYRNIEHKLVPDAYEAEIIRKIFELYGAEESTASSVAVEMNNSSYERRDMQNGGTKPFTYDFVARTLDNPFYCGRLCYNRKTNRKDRNGKPLRSDPSRIITVQGKHEAIVSEEVWDRIHEKRVRASEQHKKSAPNVYVHVLSGLVRCPVCGGNLTGSVVKTKNNAGDGYYKSISYYQCRNSSKQNGSLCSFTRRLNQEIVDGLVFEIIGRLQCYGEFMTVLQNALCTGDTVESKEQRLKELRTELSNAEFLKNKLGEQLDSLNPMKAGYDKKYERLSAKLDEAYDRIDDLEEELQETKKELDSISKKAGSFTNATEFLKHLKSLTGKMTSEEKKEFCNLLIEKIEVFPEERTDGRIIRSITFRFPLAFDGQEFITNGSDGNAVSLTLDCTDIDIPLPQKGGIVMQMMEDGSQKVIVRKPTYAAIKRYVKEHYGSCVSTLNIAQIKRKYVLDMGKAYNKPEEPKSRVPRCTPEKEKMILEALKHFDLLDESTEYMEEEQS